jgi:hypothetical protein
MEAQTGPGGGAGIGSTATPARAADAWPQRTEFDASGSGRLYTEYLVKGLNWEQMAMARDESGRYVHATVSNYHDGGLEFIYDRYAELCNTNTEKGAFGWASCVTYTNWPISNVVNKWFFRTFDPNNTALGLEKMGYAPGLQLDRYQRPKLMVKGDSYAGVAANYLVYFDEASGDIIFRTFQIGSASPSRPLRMGFENTALKDSQSRDYSTTYTNCTENVQIGPSRNDSAWGDGRNIAVSGGSKYFDSGVTSDNRVIIVYYDENDARLKLAYSDKNIDGSKTTGIPFTQGNAVLPDYTGMYVSMTIDAQDGIHIAAFDAKDSDLAYIYLPRYDAAACQAVIVDQFGSVGNWTDIKVRGGVPYIAYYNATETGGRDSIKLAWAKTAVQGNAGVQSGTDAAGYTSSGWEYATVPAIDPPQGGTQKFRKVNLDFDSAGRPVLGYLGTNIEFSRPVGE